MADLSKSALLSAHDLTSQRWVMVSVMLGTGIVSINNNSFNPAIPQFMHDFRLAEVSVSWLMIIFLLTMSLSLLLASFLSQRFGQRRIYLISLFVFMMSSVLGAFATQFPVVLAARALQGISNGLMVPLSLGILYSVIPKNERSAVTGQWSGMMMLSLAAGPMIGALVLAWLDWQSLFLINIPLACFAWIIGCIFIPKPMVQVQPVSFNWSSFAWLTGSVVSLLVALSQVQQLADLSGYLFILLLLVSLFSAGLFYRTRHNQLFPIINWQLFQSSIFNKSLIISTVHTAALFILLLLIPLLIQNTLSLSVLWTGFLLMISALITSLCAKRVAQYLNQQNAKWLVSIGLCFSSMGFIGLSLIQTNALWPIAVCLIIHSVGFGLSYMPATTTGLNQLEQQVLINQGASLNNLLRRLFATIAVLLAALYLQLKTHYSLPTDSISAVQIHAIHELFAVCASMMLLVLPLALKFPSAKL